MPLRMRARFWMEVVSSSGAAGVGALTLAWRDWIEVLLGIDPDHRNGSLEWFIAIGLFAAALIVAMLARFEWRQSRKVALGPVQLNGRPALPSAVTRHLML
jgi:hypothetical protein